MLRCPVANRATTPIRIRNIATFAMTESASRMLRKILQPLDLPGGLAGGGLALKLETVPAGGGGGTGILLP
jgi:hypothetical protein